MYILPHHRTFFPQKSAKKGNEPNLQRPRPQHPRPLILGHIWRRTPLRVRDSLLLETNHRILLHPSRRTAASSSPCCSISTHDNHIPIRMMRRRSPVHSDTVKCLIGQSRGAVYIIDVIAIGRFEGGFFFVEGWFVGFVAVGGEKELVETRG